MAELISQVESFEGIMAAVVNGADAVYLSFDYMGAGYRATEMEIKRATGYCRARGVKLYVAIEIFPSDEEFAHAVGYARLAWRLGADAAVVSDVGLAKAIREAAPDMPVHAGTRFALFNSGGMKVAAAMGFSRVYLPKELTKEEIFAISTGSNVETAVMVQGDMCSCIDGFCRMSSLLNGKREAKLDCNRACRYPYTMVGSRNEYPLSMKDNCLIRYLGEMMEGGVDAFVVSGYYKKPEYIAMATNVYYNYLKDMENVHVYDCITALGKAYTGREMTDLYYLGKKGEIMSGAGDCDQSMNYDYVQAKKNYKSREFNRVPVNFVAIIKHGEPVRLAAGDNDGNIVSVEGPVPDVIGTHEIRRATVLNQCKMTGGTPYICDRVRTVIDKGLYFSGQEMGKLVSAVLDELTVRRTAFDERNVYGHTVPENVENSEDKPEITVSVLKTSQLSDELLELAPSVVYIPAEKITKTDSMLKKFIASPKIKVCAVLPGVIKDGEMKDIVGILKNLKSIGIDEVSVSNITHIVIARGLGFKVRGDMALNITNATALSIYKRLGLKSALLSVELKMEQIKDMPKSAETEIIGYGRIPLMYTQRCIIKDNSGLCTCENLSKLTNENGVAFSVAGGFGCRNTIYSPRKIYIGNKPEDYEHCGLWAVRLCFTTEHASECAKITGRFMGRGNYEPTFYTTGLYYRGAE